MYMYMYIAKEYMYICTSFQGAIYHLESKDYYTEPELKLAAIIASDIEKITLGPTRDFHQIPDISSWGSILLLRM